MFGTARRSALRMIRCNWTAGFAQTYHTELRPESATAVCRSLPHRRLLPHGQQLAERLPTAPGTLEAAAIEGKFWSVARLVKAAFTFTGGADYMVWKIERHSGHHIELSDWQRRHPVITGFMLLPATAEARRRTLILQCTDEQGNIGIKHVRTGRTSPPVIPACRCLAARQFAGGWQRPGPQCRPQDDKLCAERFDNFGDAGWAAIGDNRRAASQSFQHHIAGTFPPRRHREDCRTAHPAPRVGIKTREQHGSPRPKFRRQGFRVPRAVLRCHHRG